MTAFRIIDRTASALQSLAIRLTLALSLSLAAFAPACSRSTEGKPAESPAATGADPTTSKLREALASPHRPNNDRARDVYRHPVETLAFFGLRDDMTVVEISPGAGWYTDVLAPVLAEKGRLVATSSDPNGPEDNYSRKGARAYAEHLKSNPAIFGKVQVQILHPPDDISFGPDGSADMVVTFRNIHNWISGGFESKVYAAAYRVLKPGGVFGVVEHRGAPGMTLEQIKKMGYVPEARVLEGVQAAGFKLVAKSEVNANPKDTKDYAEGVWTLPPTLTLKDKDRDRYVAIGESDRMTLRFVK